MTEAGSNVKGGMELLLEAARTLFEESDLEQLTARLLDRAFMVSGAERGYLILRDADGELRPVRARSIEPEALPEGDPSRSIVAESFRQRRPILSRNAARDPRFSGAESIILRGIRYACCIPLELRGIRIGALYLDAGRAGGLTEDNLPLLEAFGLLAALALDRLMELDSARKAISAASGGTRFNGIVGESEAMRQLYERMDRFAAADLPVLISGESGTGKELVARALHSCSRRKQGPFRAIFCGNLTPELLESELFGYKKGAFTGAVTDKPGLLDLADGGALLLDEIADVPPAIQPKLLRFLQDGEYQRLGDPKSRRADVRILSATHKKLPDEIAAGRFREDLYYRVNVLALEVPPVRERDGDVPLLAAAILARVAARTGQPPRRVSPATLKKLAAHRWPGNVRELENVLARAAVLAAGEVIEPEDIDLQVTAVPEPVVAENQTLAAVVEAHLKTVLRLTGGNRSEAARVLGVSRRYLQKTLSRWREEEEEGWSLEDGS